MMMFNCRVGKDLGNKNEFRKATISQGQDLEESASHALMRCARGKPRGSRLSAKVVNVVAAA